MNPRERFARQVVARLNDAGHIAYFAGGCVRDAIVGRHPKDFDVATDATPERIREVFGRRKTLAIGAAFGVVSVLGRKDRGEDPIEVATFRCDGKYSDGRRPDSVVYSSPKEDAQRRDFTINGLFYDPIKETVIDYVGGQDDLKLKRIRAIGDPDARIAEDKLRMLRAVRFAAVFDFEIEADSLAAVTEHSSEIGSVSGERIGAEMRRLLGCASASTGIGLLVQTGLAEVVFPDLAHAWEAAVSIDGVGSNGDVHNTVEQLLSLRRSPDFISGVACCLFAIRASCGHRGKIDVIADAWRLANEEVDQIKFALKHYQTFADADEKPWSAVQPLLVHRYSNAALILAEILVEALGWRSEGVHFCRSQLQRERSEIDPPSLVNGQTLKELGMQAGPRFKEIIQAVRDLQLDGQLKDEADAIEHVRANYLNRS